MMDLGRLKIRDLCTLRSHHKTEVFWIKHRNVKGVKKLHRRLDLAPPKGLSLFLGLDRGFDILDHSIIENFSAIISLFFCLSCL